MNRSLVPRAPGALPVIGHGWQMITDPTAFLASLPQHGDLVEIKIGSRSTYVVCSPDLVASVLLNLRHDFDKGGPFFDNLTTFLGDGLATCPNAKHARLRRLMQPAFRKARVEAYSQIVQREISRIVESWSDGEAFDAYRAMQDLAMRMTVSTMFSAWSPVLEKQAVAEKILDSASILVRGTFIRMVMPRALTRLPLPVNRRHHRVKLELDRLISEIIATYRHAGEDYGDLLSAFLWPDENGDQLSDGEICDQVITTLIAGIGATAAMLGWTLYYISCNTVVDEAISDEVGRVCGDRMVEYKDIPHLRTISNTITETLRIAPAAWLSSRVAVNDITLGNHLVRAGTPILLTPYALHHRADLYSDPERFDIYRWDGLNATTAERATTYIPFGFGPRKCISQNFTITNAVLAMAAIHQRWRLVPATSRPVRPSGRMVLEPRNLFLRALPRRPVTRVG
ncbi:cytochrome P450 [Rhizomonospora bruguierae]|uniref:cytochrome P450 n=1 Tax=Rhizomonospora bruguierae TaxID=1581705 RepID=UPI001BCA72B2|nr:cytochrome P450 [Micromonospora sp. NBRC 107566]